METLILAFLIIIIIYIFALVVFIVWRYCRILQFSTSSKYHQVKESNQSLQIHETIQRQSATSEENNRNQESELNTNKIHQNQISAILQLSNQNYQVILINDHEIRYQKMDLDTRNISEEQVYEFKYDQCKNEKFSHYNLVQNELIVYEGKGNTQIYKGQFAQSKIAYFQVNSDQNPNEQYFYNTLITEEFITQGNVNILNAFAEHINMQERELYIKNKNQDENTQKKMILFIPSYVLNDQNPRQKFEEYLFYYEPIQYQIEIFFESIFFIAKSPLNSNYLLLEVSLKNQNIFLHYYRKTDYNNQQVQTYCQNVINRIYPEVKKFILCTECNNKNQKQITIYDVCEQIQNHSNQQSKGVLKDYIKNELFKL